MIYATEDDMKMLARQFETNLITKDKMNILFSHCCHCEIPSQTLCLAHARHHLQIPQTSHQCNGIHQARCYIVTAILGALKKR